MKIKDQEKINPQKITVIKGKGNDIKLILSCARGPWRSDLNRDFSFVSFNLGSYVPCLSRVLF